MHIAPLRLLTTCLLATLSLQAVDRPNIIVYFADDISAREFPIYGSSVWTAPDRSDTTDPEHLARTPVMDRLATEGCWVTTAWSATVCMPARAMMMTGRYAHLHKWWHNKDKGEALDQKGNYYQWPLYESSPLQIGHLAQQAGYGSYWAGKTQMGNDLMRYGFDEGCFTPGSLQDRDNPYTDFKMVYKNLDGKRTLINVDTGLPTDFPEAGVKTYLQHGWYWYPHVRLMNDPAAPGELSWWPNDAKSEKNFGLATYGPDVELDFVFNFMERTHEAGKPFFIYHTTHLGHAGYDWFSPRKNGQCWVGTPKLRWDGERYHRTEPTVTGDQGVYDTHGTVTEPGMRSHIEYIDYQIWCYLEKLKEMGVEKDTIIIITADNGTGGYGKDSPDRQKGVHVPFIVYAPGVETAKQGRQDVLLNISDVLPTVAEIMGAAIPDEYEINGESFWTWLTTDQKQHRDWIYAYKGDMQLVRGQYVMKDGYGKWWDVSGDEPEDLISYQQITNWNQTLEIQREERKQLELAIKPYDMHAIEHDKPGVPPNPNARYLQLKKKKKK
ncbi:sulfatase-like hydrolase/transferase [Coraliomargarita akajimensis]|uniref:Sulfatase n=1 Tax=Coraliomargarita akajimensis (strain DSM 45221 / IAM 15411 / JCM 23193 / KCTC 12865 / 04OKA010-24) TaxID=583355 RepID=D5EN51_CORAD|nr:sulfatase-like hydrolase/transferase [Coraliomargarita akajimensis]ADE53486.1 sulfatase [Coraliomargarita akajimensis DSM 45221]